MPLPWKKHRISQLVADLQSPAKRRGSLVVETGFPTSLVDLFVKNRDRLRRTSNKHAHRRGIDIPFTPTEIQIPLSSSTEVLSPPNKGKFEAIDVTGGSYCDSIEPIKFVDGNSSFANRISAAVLKTFVVVALALSTKKLVVGITLSAFVLLLLEYAGNHIDIDVVVFLKPCLDASGRVLDLIRRGLSLFRTEKALTRMKKCIASKRLVVQENAMLCDSLDEIESVRDSNFEEEIRGGEEGAGLGCVIVEREQNCVDKRIPVEGNDDRREEALLYGKNESRSRRIKAKIIKKCVPKKLRDLRKKGKGTGLEEDGSERSSYFNIQEQGDCAEDKLGGDNKDDESQIQSYCELPRASLEGREGSSGYQMLILVTLIGLVGSRIWAFALTLVWCLALKSIGNRRSLENLPLIRSLVSIWR